MATANQSPENIQIAQLVSFTTTNLDSGDLFEEPHTVSGPTGSFSVPLSIIPIVGNKIVIPLTSNTSAGANYLKLHLPQPGSSEFYVTYAQKNSAMADGYYDYQSGIPSGYRSDLRTFIADGTTIFPNQQTTFSKTLVFTVYGLDTNQVSAAIQYSVRFSALFGNVVAPPPRNSGN